MKKIVGWYILGVVTFLLVVTAYLSLITVGAGQRGVLMNWGAVSNAPPLEPGLHWIVPIMQSVALVDVRIQKTQSAESAASKDLQIVTTGIALNFSLDPAKVGNIWKTLGGLTSVYQKVVEPTISNAVKAVTAHYNADELVANRDLVRNQIEDQLKQQLSLYGIFVSGLNITQFSFSPEYDHAIEDKQVAQQQALKAQYQLQQTQIESQKRVVNAKADAEARIEQARGTAQSTILIAKADAKAMELKSASVTPLILQLNAIQQWNGKLPTYMGSNGPLPFLSVNQ